MAQRVLERDEVARVVDSIASANKVQDRTVVGMRAVAKAIAHGRSVEKACKESGVTVPTFWRWRKRYSEYEELIRGLLNANQAAREAGHEARRAERMKSQGLVLEASDGPERLGLEDFRMAYFGRPTPAHHRLAVEALEDQSNLYVFIFGPTGMGKDTLAGDYVAWEVAPDVEGKRVAWFMESAEFSKRRMQRLSKYLVDPKVYDHRPANTPGGGVPVRSLIDDYGPFRWESGMVHPDGSKVERPVWTANSMFFVRNAAPEQDPNLWATGIGGATYGSRIDVCVLSDAFTVENQATPAPRVAGMAWVEGTLDTRLDEKGRLVVIGTMLPVENNYEVMLEKYSEGARVVSEKSDSHSRLVKYSNGVAVVVVKAIAEVDGREVSYWPERFPLDNEYHWKGKVWREADLSAERILELTSKGAKFVRGLTGRRARNPVMFKAMYQQERDLEVGGDFTEETFERALDPLRSFGQVRPSELVVVGIDPARRYGAGWVALAVDRHERTCTVVDFFFGENLGVTGIKQRLILEPLAKWNPVWLCYETNQHGAILEDSLIQQAVRDAGVSVYGHNTGRERNAYDVGVGSIAAYMRAGQFLLPAATREDRVRVEVLKSHFKAWDSSVISSGGRSRPGTPRHVPDDLAMASWVGWLKARELLEGSQHRTRGITFGVPLAVRRKFDRMGKERAVRYRHDDVPAEELVARFVGG